MSLSKYMGKPLCRTCGRPQEEGEGWEKTVNDWRGSQRKHVVCPEKVCKHSVNRGDHRFIDLHPCGRNGKGQNDKGEWLCGIHLAALKKVQKNNAAFAERQSNSYANKERAEIVRDILHELDINVSAQYSWPVVGAGEGRYTGKIIIDAADLLKLAGINVQLPPRID